MKEKSFEYYINVNNKKYVYTLKKSGAQATFVECEAAKVAQKFLNEDIPALLSDLPNLILSEQKYRDKNEQVIRFRVSEEDKKIIMKKAYAKGYKNLSVFLRHLALGG